MNSITLATVEEWRRQFYARKSRIKKIALGSFLPQRITSKFRSLDIEKTKVLIESLSRYFSSTYDAAYLESDRFKYDFYESLFGRTEERRYYDIPWIDSERRLDGVSLLEISCGTGSSTIAYAEQGAKVVTIDIDQNALEVASNRCELYGVQAEFRLLNASHIGYGKLGSRFDIIVYIATLEHLTVEERITSLKKAWELLQPAGLLVMCATPNRLWYYDGHTSLLPFFHWLPDDLALRYARFSGRENFRNTFQAPVDTDMLRFLRWGRGVSFHEIELALGPLSGLEIRSSLSAYRKRKYPLAAFLMNRTREYGAKHRYQKLFSRLFPHIPVGFFQEHLDIIIRKTERPSV